MNVLINLKVLIESNFTLAIIRFLILELPYINFLSFNDMKDIYIFETNIEIKL